MCFGRGDGGGRWGVFVGGKGGEMTEMRPQVRVNFIFWRRSVRLGVKTGGGALAPGECRRDEVFGPAASENLRGL